ADVEPAAVHVVDARGHVDRPAGGADPVVIDARGEVLGRVAGVVDVAEIVHPGRVRGRQVRQRVGDRGRVRDDRAGERPAAGGTGPRAAGNQELGGTHGPATVGDHRLGVVRVHLDRGADHSELAVTTGVQRALAGRVQADDRV